ncbi:thiamine phosphate synthase [Arcobacter sp. YIC-464]|uniref:thiamine phosphate synthase n=1 Tax=Arcobacter sp. YIC-464 TaxID=3376631 RepID=UPI003C22B5EF
MKTDLKRYLITDPKYYSSNVELFKKNLQRILTNHKIDMACFRDKSSENFEELAEIFVETCKEFNIDKILINKDFKLAKKLGATGVHLTSEQFKKIKKAKELDLYVIISCHRLSDIEKAQESYANAVTYSPIFDTPNKGEAKGINALKQAINLYDDMDIIALGGIVSKEHIEQIEKAKPYGFASIRYFV